MVKHGARKKVPLDRLIQGIPRPLHIFTVVHSEDFEEYTRFTVTKRVVRYRTGCIDEQPGQGIQPNYIPWASFDDFRPISSEEHIFSHNYMFFDVINIHENKPGF